MRYVKLACLALALVIMGGVFLFRLMLDQE